jgi:hypothetical protein
MLLTEHKEVPPSANSIYSRSVFHNLITLQEHIDFRDPKFMNRMKRTRSAGSVQALIVELALQDPAFMKSFRSYLLNNGANWHQFQHYTDRYTSIPTYNKSFHNP